MFDLFMTFLSYNYIKCTLTFKQFMYTSYNIVNVCAAGVLARNNYKFSISALFKHTVTQKVYKNLKHQPDTRASNTTPPLLPHVS